MRIIKSPIKPNISVPPPSTVGAYPRGLIFGMWMNEGGRLILTDFVNHQDYNSFSTNFLRPTGPSGRYVFFNATDGTYAVRTSGGIPLVSPKALNPKTFLYRMAFHQWDGYTGDSFENVVQKISNGNGVGWLISHEVFPTYTEVRLRWTGTGAHFGVGNMDSRWIGPSLPGLGNININSQYWWDVAVVSDGSIAAANQKIYFNGHLGTYDSANSVNALGALDNDVASWMSILTSQFDGALDYMFMFDRALSVQEIRDINAFPYRWYSQDLLDWVSGIGGVSLSAIPGLLNTPTRMI